MRNIVKLLIFVTNLLLISASIAEPTLVFPQNSAQWTKALSLARHSKNKKFRQRGIYVAQDTPHKAGALVKFAFNSAIVKPNANPALDSLGRTLKNQLPDAVLLIIGYTDSIGSAKYNLRLSKLRAKAVQTYLVRYHKIARSRLKTTGYGESNPIASNINKTGRALNRRVEFQRIR